MPRKRKPAYNNFDWNLVSIKPDATELDAIRAWKKKNSLEPFALVEAILSHQIKLAISNDVDHDCYIVTITPKGPRYDDLKSSFTFRNDDLETVLWVVAYYCALDQFEALADRTTTDNWRL